MTTTKTGAPRLEYLDWVRGIGAIIMLQGHVFDSFLRPDLRGGGAFVYSQFLGGMPPAIFLFLTGVTLAFLMDSTERKGIAPATRVTTALKRAGYLFVVAFVFRLQLWLFSQGEPWTDILKVDILNCMGFALALMSLMALFRTVERARLCAILGLAIAFASPVISQLNWGAVHPAVRAYWVPDYRYFSFFPWGAYVAFGMSAGSVIRATPKESLDRVMQWGAIFGGGLILACQYFSALPFSLYGNSEYWLNSPALVLTKVAVVLLMMATAFVWTRYAASPGWSWVRQFGTTSLLVYWVHIELVYGRWLAPYKNTLAVGQTVMWAVIIILMMLALSSLRTNFGTVRAWVSDMVVGPRPKFGSAEGD